MYFKILLKCTLKSTKDFIFYPPNRNVSKEACARVFPTTSEAALRVTDRGMIKYAGAATLSQAKQTFN